MRLFGTIAGANQYTDYTYTAGVAIVAQKPAMIAPIPGSTITGGSATFTWSPGVLVTHYYLWVGTSLGANNLYRYDGGTSLATSVVVSGLPTNGSTIYVRLFGLINGTNQSTDYTYTVQ